MGKARFAEFFTPGSNVIGDIYMDQWVQTILVEYQCESIIQLILSVRNHGFSGYT